MTCSQCGGEHAVLGVLGHNEWFRCIRCGWEECWPIDRNAQELADDAFDTLAKEALWACT